MFSKAIVRTPCEAMVYGITSADLGLPNYELAKIQHMAYIEALTACGLEVIVLDADEFHPDSVFVEDTAVINNAIAVVANPYPDTRKGETTAVKEKLAALLGSVAEIKPPGTFEGGDVMQVDRHFYVGLSERTNQEGIDQFTSIQKELQFEVTAVDMKDLLHLKTGISYLENNTLVMVDAFESDPLFKDFNRIIIDEDEAYAANCIRVNDFVLVPSGFLKTAEAISKAGFQVKLLDMSEFRKLDGGLSCLSLRF